MSAISDWRSRRKSARIAKRIYGTCQAKSNTEVLTKRAKPYSGGIKSVTLSGYADNIPRRPVLRAVRHHRLSRSRGDRILRREIHRPRIRRRRPQDCRVEPLPDKQVTMETQNGAIISAIRKKPGISRSELTDVRCNGFRIANVTARISECRWILMKTGETIVCSE